MRELGAKRAGVTRWPPPSLAGPFRTGVRRGYGRMQGRTRRGSHPARAGPAGGRSGATVRVGSGTRRQVAVLAMPLDGRDETILPAMVPAAAAYRTLPDLRRVTGLSLAALATRLPRLQRQGFLCRRTAAAGDEPAYCLSHAGEHAAVELRAAAR
jgi:hypothetical protein